MISKRSMILTEFCGVLGALEVRIGYNDRMVNFAELLRLGKHGRLASIGPTGCGGLVLGEAGLLDEEVNHFIGPCLVLAFDGRKEIW